MTEPGPNLTRLAALKGLGIASKRYGGKDRALAAMHADPALAEQFLRQGLAVVEVQMAVARREGWPFPDDTDDDICRRLLRVKAGLPACTRAEALAADVE